MMKRTIKVHAYKLSDGWHFSENKRADCSTQPQKVKITLLPTAPSDTKRWLLHALRSGLAVRCISNDDAL